MSSFYGKISTAPDLWSSSVFRFATWMEAEAHTDNLVKNLKPLLEVEGRIMASDEAPTHTYLDGHLHELP